MGNWCVHWLEATGDLAPLKVRIGAELLAAEAAMARFVPPPRLDVLVEIAEDAVRPELGLLARVVRPNLVVLMIDPETEAFRETMRGRRLRRQMVNAAHRAMRTAGPGYGFTLGGALVSEGLAAQFVRLVFATPLEPWEEAPEEVLAANWPDARELMSTRYDPGEWFGGKGARPAGIGYALGARIAEMWLTSGVPLDPMRFIDVPSPKVLAALREDAMAG